MSSTHKQGYLGLYSDTMKPEIVTEANKIWERFTKNVRENEFTLPFKIHKEIISLFQVGEFYYYVFHVKNSVFELISEEVSTILGYDREDLNVPFLLSKIHPEDQVYFLNFENKVTEFFATLTTEQKRNYKVSYDYRIQKKDGCYLRILQQVFTIDMDAEGNVIRTFGVHTNISHLKTTGNPSLSFIGLNGEPSFLNVNVKQLYSSNSFSLTARELEIISLLVEGKNSSQISAELFISKSTVETHRKNILRKTGCSNSVSLSTMAIEKGWHR